MRRDVLEAMAEEIAGRPVDALASFVTWDDGRRKLDGMAKGRRWDIDREHRAFEKDTAREVRRLMKLRARHRNPEVYRAWHRRYEAANKERRRELRTQRYWKRRGRELAKMRAYREKNREELRRKALARRWANIEKNREVNRKGSLARYYANHEANKKLNRERYRAKAKAKRVNKCGLCHQAGHTRRTCSR